MGGKSSIIMEVSDVSEMSVHVYHITRFTSQKVISTQSLPYEPQISQIFKKFNYLVLKLHVYEGQIKKERQTDRFRNDNTLWASLQILSKRL